MTLPQLRSSAAAQREPVDFVSVPPQLPATSSTRPSVCEVLHLPVLTATSLRPARPSRSSHAVPLPVSPKESERSHPLLNALLCNTAGPSASSTHLTSPPVPSVHDAIDELGGADRFEALLQQLHDLPQHHPHQQLGKERAASSPVVRDAVQRCVEHALNLPPDAVQVSCAEEDPLMYHVQIPLRGPAEPKTSGAPPRPCLYLRMHRQRGVLALHVIDLRFQGPQRRARLRTTREVAVVKRKRTRGLQSTRLPAPPSEPAAPLALPAGETPLRAQAGPSSSLSPNAGFDHTQFSSVICRPSEKSRDAAALVSVESAMPTRLSPQPVHGNAKAARRTKSTRQKQKPHASNFLPQRGVKDALEFDPLHPEETTPFNAQHRPLTFNAAIAFSPQHVAYSERCTDEDE